MKWRAVESFAVLVCACSSVVPSDAPMSSTSSGEPTEVSSTTSSSTTTWNDDDTPVAEIGSGFIPPTDLPPFRECEIWAQDCPVGQKCMPWGTDGGATWNDTRCSPVVDDPVAVGEPCTVQENGVSGIDDCELGAMCWDVDPKTNTGTCVAQCRGNEGHPICAPGTACLIGAESLIVLCLPICNPVAQPCYEGQGCYPTGDLFACLPDASGVDGSFGEGCEFLNVCDAGLHCAAPEVVPGCTSGQGCCNAFCDIETANDCPGQGQQCVRWYDIGEAPPGLETVGACAL